MRPMERLTRLSSRSSHSPSFTVSCTVIGVMELFSFFSVSFCALVKALSAKILQWKVFL